MLLAFGTPEVSDVIVWYLALGLALLVGVVVVIALFSFSSVYAITRRKLDWSRRKSVLAGILSAVVGLAVLALYLNT